MKIAMLLRKNLKNHSSENMKELLKELLAQTKTIKVKKGIKRLMSAPLDKVNVTMVTITWWKLREDETEKDTEKELYGYAFSVLENSSDLNLEFNEICIKSIKQFFMPICLNEWFDVTEVFKKAAIAEEALNY